ncbi:MAG: efflux RND transporter periplasmic adaptor subunit [Microcystis sp.]|uniref:efflux RND transporter periplasmic adaptor subunit n=1 Tax=Microcystis sp. TaxID=1127 RepID=UPI0022BFAFE0|nr:efflux RND transporter periplasmic adaptor subunit [Microcystis sp. LE17-20D]MCZ8067932.1 efflux RND transporter periplasmic adaptor subunit [Microcystis sp. LE17-20D]MCZ8276634.1 efflux RND transporter periplasmic adaptor subunit [Microcystis sp. LE19-4.1E]
MSWKPIGLIAIPATVLLLVSGYLVIQAQSRQDLESQETVATSSRLIVADGRLEPQGEVLLLSAPFSMERARVEKLFVERGDWVKAGNTVAILDSHAIMQAALQNALKQEKIALTRLQQVKSGAKTGDIAAQKAKIFQTKAELKGQIATQEAKIATLRAQLAGERSSQMATVERIQAELKHASRECDRYRNLRSNGAVSMSQMESICLQQDTTQEQLQEAQANLNRIINSGQEEIKEATGNLARTKATLKKEIEQTAATYDATAEVRPVDVAVAEAELAAARTAVRQAQANVDLTLVKSPLDGQVLEIHARPGEMANQGIVDLGRTNRMFVVAEVYETDIGRVKLEQKVEVKSPALREPLEGKVSEIGWQVGKKDVLNDDPVIAADARVVKVRVLLNEESSQRAAKLTNLKVDTFIKS